MYTITIHNDPAAPLRPLLNQANNMAFSLCLGMRSDVQILLYDGEDVFVFDCTQADYIVRESRVTLKDNHVGEGVDKQG